MATLAPALVVLVQGHAHSRRHLRARRGRRRGLQAAYKSSEEEIVESDAPAAQAPENLYGLLGVSPNAEASVIKQAYYDKMKVCHPDVAGEEGVEMCMLLNDAYDLLSDPDRRVVYNEQVVGQSAASPAVVEYDPNDQAPTWKWSPKAKRDEKPQYTGRPLSRSLWERVDAEDRGEKWTEQQFVFVDEWTCIACRNCCDVAPKTFCIDAVAGRARVYSQWGNSEEYLDYAVKSCPVDCIYWVSRDELQALEYVTRRGLYEVGYQLPCPMQRSGAGEDPFQLAREFRFRERRKQERSKKRGLGGTLAESSSGLTQRIKEVFGGLSEALRKAGWGR